MARYIYVFRKKMKGLEDHVEVSINPEASFQCSVDRRIIPDQWSRLVDYWHSAKFQAVKQIRLQKNVEPYSGEDVWIKAHTKRDCSMPKSQDCSPANSQHHNRFSSASNDTPTHEVNTL